MHLVHLGNSMVGYCVAVVRGQEYTEAISPYLLGHNGTPGLDMELAGDPACVQSYVSEEVEIC